jgi:hypothetical protein
VAHVVIDGVILTKRTREMFGGKKQVVQTPGATDRDDDWMDDDSRRLSPESIAKVQRSNIWESSCSRVCLGVCLASSAGSLRMDFRVGFEACEGALEPKLIRGSH